MNAPSLLLVVVLAVLFGGFAMTRYCQRYSRLVIRSNALSQTADMIRYFVDRNNGKPPSDWDDLKLAFDYTNAGYGSFEFDEIQEVVLVDFTALKERTAAPYVRVIGNRGALSIAEIDANKRIDRSLKKKKNTVEEE